MKTYIPLLILIALVTLYFHLNYSYIKDLGTNLRQESTLTVYIIGDFGQLKPYSNYTVLPCKQVAELMKNRSYTSPPSIILTTGDNFYVNREYVKLFSVINSVFTDIFTGENIVNVPWYLSYGNHDISNGRVLGDLLGEFYPNIHMPEGSWNMTKVMIGYKIDFSVLQPDIICHKKSKNHIAEGECRSMFADDSYSEVYNWLENHYKALDSDPEVLWRIVVLHYPIFSVSTTGLDSENLKIYLLPLLRKFKVDLVLSGHNHNMQYFVSHHDKHAKYVKQPERNECLATSAITCGTKRVHCEFTNTTCENSNKSCENKISIESSPGLEQYNKSVEFKKGQALHQIVQGGGGSDLDAFCPNLESPMADYRFGRVEYGYTELKITKSALLIEFISTKTSDTIFKSSIVI